MLFVGFLRGPPTNLDTPPNISDIRSILIRPPDCQRSPMARWASASVILALDQTESSACYYGSRPRWDVLITGCFAHRTALRTITNRPALRLEGEPSVDSWPREEDWRSPQNQSSASSCSGREPTVIGPPGLARWIETDRFRPGSELVNRVRGGRVGYRAARLSS